MNRYSYSLLGSLIAIISARAYVSLGGSLNFTIFNHTLHHLYYGLGILILLPILKRKGISYQWIYFLIGFALGLISDEADLLLSIGSAYTLQLYYNPVNYATDLILILTFFRLSQTHNYVHGLLYDTERVL